MMKEKEDGEKERIDTEYFRVTFCGIFCSFLFLLADGFQFPFEIDSEAE